MSNHPAPTLGDALRARSDQEVQAVADEQYANAKAWQDDPNLELQGRRLDIAAEHDPNFYNSPGLGFVRQEVANYRRRKATAADIVATREAANS